MVLTKTPVDFVERSLQLLQAHPNTTRITTTYHITPPPSDASKAKSRPKPTKESTTTSSSAPSAAETKPPAPRGKLTLKTYDPISGSIIKFRTDKISDVGRLVSGLHRLGRSMGGLADVVPDVNTTAGGGVGGGGGDAAPTVGKDAVTAAVVDAGAAEAANSGAATGRSKGGKKKNKKKK